VIEPSIDASLSAHVTPTNVGHRRRGRRGRMRERVLAPAGQLVLAGNSGQLGLDGRVYAVPAEPATPDAPDARSAESSPRSLKGDPTPDEDHAGSGRSQNQPQGSLPLDELARLPQLSFGYRMDTQRGAAGGLPAPQRHQSRARQNRCRLPAIGSSLVRCATAPLPENKGDILVSRDAFGATRPRGLMLCDSMFCAGCGPDRCRRASVQLQLVLEHARARYPEGAAVMMTLTVPHLATDTAKQTVEVLYSARRALRATPEWRRVTHDFGVAVEVYALDIAFGGPNGTHPHFHVLVVFERMPLVSQRASIEAELRQLVAKQDQRLRFKHGFVGRWATRFARDQEAKPLHGRTPKEIADDPTTARISVLCQLLDALPLTTPATMQFGDASPAFQRAFLDGISVRLKPAWARCVDTFMLRCYGRGIDDHAAFDRKALDLRPGENAASYLVGWAFDGDAPSKPNKPRRNGWDLEHEVVATTSKGESHLRVLDLIGTWDTSTVPWQQNAAQKAKHLYQEAIIAVRGKHWLIGLTAALKAFDITDEEVEARAEQLREEREATAIENGEQLVTPLEYVIRRRHWPTACDLGLGPTFTWIDKTADRLEAAGYSTAKQRAAVSAVAASNGPPAADRQLSFERQRAQGVRDEQVLDLEVELQRQIDRYLEALTLERYARDRERYRRASR
jgi:hypothetical protein